MKKPQECNDMADIRAEIDQIDRQIINLIGERFDYVKAAAKFKTTTASVKAPERFQAMLADRRDWAEVEGLNPDVIAKMYTDLVNYFIAEEMKHLQDQ
jgi:isochorismate pyruvate lyase